MHTAQRLLGLVLLSTWAASACASTSHPTTQAVLGVARSSSALEAVVDQPGPLSVETIVAADWQVSRGGLIDLDDPRAKAAHLVDGDEPIALYVHVVRHPQKGTFLVDTGAERAFVADPDHALIRGMFGSLAHLDQLKVRRDTASIVRGAGGAIAGVFLTHLHFDHVLGMRDVPASAPVYVGAGDAADRSFMNLLMEGLYDDALENKGPLRELHFAADPSATFDGLVDVFGDGSFWAIWVPGHTPGTIAYLARTASGPVLLTGDACHTAWGWEHGVAPGSFSDDIAKSARSLARLEDFVKRHPQIDVRLGHQALAQRAH
jgi:N-acyl homoserine lactone hydrolase